MVREDLCLVSDAIAGDLFDPLGDAPVAIRPRGARDLLVRDIADEEMPEGILGLILHG